MTFESDAGRKTVELMPLLLWGERAFFDADAKMRDAIFGGAVN
ncbi:hypothetical protein [Nocardioides sp. CER19]|nr:hypothetical protein [Nocardioides sp. CER19]MDH2415280.1 hypothetical protein [Nocardioides sp. CER19]